ncbi:MAG: radical SAM family heme chaperone HemW [Proteocatella sp.]
MKNLSVYIHVPFCKRKCSYCDFVSVSKPHEYQEKYIDALVLEITSSQKLSESHNLNTIYIGGGTPSYLNEALLEKLLVAIGNVYNLATVKEYTFECNPESVSEDKFRLLKKYGVNRISFGLQSTNDEELLALRRSHDFKTFLDSYALARKIGFKNISVDLMFSIPGQSMDSLGETLKNIVEIAPEHISCYSLIVEENTLMNRWVNEGKICLHTDDEYVDMYRLVTDFLEKKDYTQYEISNFSKKGYESIHNKAYWIRDNYLGLGVAAHSLIDDRRFANIENIDDYMEKIEDMESPVSPDSVEKLTPSDIVNEMIFLGLRMNQGIEVAIIKEQIKKTHERHGPALEAAAIFDTKIHKLCKANLLEIQDNRISLTQKGREISNTVFAELMVD